MAINISTILIFLLIVLSCSNWVTCQGKNHEQGSLMVTKANELLMMAESYYSLVMTSSMTLMATNTPQHEPNGGSSVFLNVLDYGAIGDGDTDDTKAFIATWAHVCKVETSTMLVPSRYVFLVKPISLDGTNCRSNIVLQLDGTIIAPRSSSAWIKGILQWIEFKNLNNGIMIKGKGIIDGQGSVWWTRELSTRPTALRFIESKNITVSGIKIQNSAKAHLKFNTCSIIHVFNVTISSPGDSPNTDGIHLHNSTNVLIHNSNLACGDDCVSIQTGCSEINIHDVNCGPGHGISIGGLGKNSTKACVSNITVRDTTINDTMTGVRIKTWQGGSGLVQRIMFSNIKVYRVKTPIVIDQYYCDASKCKNKTSAVIISGVSFRNIRGTYTTRSIYFACSDKLPCRGVTLANIELEPLQTGMYREPFCWQTYGVLETDSNIPPFDCLKTGKSINQTIQC